MPSSSDARLFYRCAIQRYDDALVLLRADHTTGAVYLAGYGIECIMKALILESAAPRRRKAILDLFHGARAHDYEWLRSVYMTNGGTPFPAEIRPHFTLANDWSTDLRYLPKVLRPDEAEGFLKAAEAIMSWANGRL